MNNKDKIKYVPKIKLKLPEDFEFDESWRKCVDDNLGGYIQKVITEAINKAHEEYYHNRDEYIKSNIIQYYGEMSEDQYKDFCKKRLTRVTFEDSHEVHYYVDFVSKEKTGFMVGITNERRCSIDNEGFNLNISIG